MQAHHVLLLILVFVLSISCSTRPVVYSETLDQSHLAQQDIAFCEQLAARHVPENRRIARSAGKGALVGGLLGGLEGLSRGRIASRALTGAAMVGGVTATHSAVNPNMTRRSYVEMCLRKRGHQMVGWN